jgi:hypothetical protein|tara:strand:- start:223 stop:453 length:231 start_codon:yes stop_codon:yes gene_type:complete
VTFDEYWQQENRLLELSYKESVRQLGERRVKKKEECDTHTKEKEDSGECCKQEKPNALDEFWKDLGEPEKCKKPTR